MAGYKLKEAGTSHWQDPNYASDEYVFKALPGGVAYASGSWYFSGLGTFGRWWTTSPNGTEMTLIYMYNYGYMVAYYYYPKYYGCQVRCVKD